MKLGLQNTTKKVLELIENGDDFIVSELRTGLFFKIPYRVEDTEPHVCDFKDAGVDNQTIAFYFAYLIACQDCEVVSVNSKKQLSSNERIKLADHVVFGKIENKYMDKVEEKRRAREIREQKEKERQEREQRKKAKQEKEQNL